MCVFHIIERLWRRRLIVALLCRGIVRVRRVKSTLARCAEALRPVGLCALLLCVVSATRGGADSTCLVQPIGSWRYDSRRPHSLCVLGIVCAFQLLVPPVNKWTGGHKLLYFFFFFRLILQVMSKFCLDRRLQTVDQTDLVSSIPSHTEARMAPQGHPS